MRDIDGFSGGGAGDAGALLHGRAAGPAIANAKERLKGTAWAKLIEPGAGWADKRIVIKTRMLDTVETHKVIDCRRNRFDVRSLVLASLQETAIAKASDPERVPALIFGEGHTLPAGKFAALMAAHALHETGLRPLVLCEWPHNQVLGRTQHPGAVYNALSTSRYAPYATAYFYHALYNNPRGALPLAFNDTATVSAGRETNIDPSCPRIRELLGSQKFSGVHVKSPDGVRIRNAFMAALAAELYDPNKYDVIVQLTGADHVFGNDNPEFGDRPYSDSLCPAFTAHAFNPVPVIISEEDYLDSTEIGEYFARHPGTLLVQRGLTEVSFCIPNNVDLIVYESWGKFREEKNTITRFYQASHAAKLGLPDPAELDFWRLKRKGQATCAETNSFE